MSTPSYEQTLWPDEIPGSTEIILSHNLLNNARHYPLDSPSTLPKRYNLANCLYDIEEAIITMNGSEVYTGQEYNLAKVKASLDGSIPQQLFQYRPGIANEVVDEKCTCKDLQKCQGHRRPVVEILEPSNLYVPCREGCLMPAEWMAKKLQQPW
ncbi:hypothetical protein D9758_007049 [Tetrapyrgos nigripes]|uniref:Uncharacterized protein n=1 Tax=Tetrapyrgos nigripes TaxID=182062 RepID=A0A8H5GDF7_9AGAR|nr:hypothetical protein D9758_007049 [Tetrapyrgos nigripes]